LAAVYKPSPDQTNLLSLQAAAAGQRIDNDPRRFKLSL
jgi:hypothetical protein